MTVPISGRLLLYGLAGPELTLSPQLELSGAYGSSPLWCVKARAKADIGIDATVLGEGLKWGTEVFNEAVDLGCAENQLPTLTVVSPKDGDTVTVADAGGLPKPLTASADDPDQGKLKVTWSSDREGPLGSPANLVLHVLGVHKLTAAATDASGASVSKTITVTVSKPTGSVTLTAQPKGGATVNGNTVTGPQGSSVLVTAKVNYSTGFPPSCSKVKWDTGGLTWQQSGPCSRLVTLSKQGTTAIKAGVTLPNGDGATGSLTAVVTAPPVTNQPQFSISASVNQKLLAPGDEFRDGEFVTLKVTYLNRAQAGTAVTWAWDWYETGGSPTKLPVTSRGAVDAADYSTRVYWSLDTEVTRHLVFRCRIYSATSGRLIATEMIPLTYQGAIG